MIEIKEVNAQNIGDFYAACLPPEDKFLRAGAVGGQGVVINSPAI